MRKSPAVMFALSLMVLGAAFWRAATPSRARAQLGTVRAANPVASTYTPVTDHFVVTTVPLLVHEESGLFDYLPKDFTSGVLKGKEIWGFNPSSLTVYQGDTVDLTLLDPSGDPHTFTMPGLGFNLDVRPQSAAEGSFVASKVGVFSFACEVAEHRPYMWGQLTVLPDTDAPQS